MAKTSIPISPMIQMNERNLKKEMITLMSPVIQRACSALMTNGDSKIVHDLRMGTAHSNGAIGRHFNRTIATFARPHVLRDGTVGSLIITGSADLDGNSFVDTTVAFILHVLFTSFIFWVPLFGKIIALGHLWFLWNLFLYSLLGVPIFHIVQKYSDGKLATALRSTFTMKAGLGIFILFPTLLSITELMFKPWFPGFIGIGYEWVWYLVFFLFGYICIISREQYYEFLNTNRKLITAVTTLLTIAFVVIRLQQHEDGIPYMDGGWIEHGIIHNELTIIGCFIHSFHAWFWCLTVFAWGSHLLNKHSSSLAYLNQGVYPFYIVHMPITFAGLKIAKKFNLTGIPAVIVGCLIVTIGCWIVFEIVRRTRITRYLFGIKSTQQKQSVTQDVNQL